MTTLPVHETYLPFTEEELAARFARVSGEPRDAQKYVRYYVESARRYRDWQRVPAQRGSKLDVQVEKDERFWTVTALMSLFHGGAWAPDLAALLRRAFPDDECPLDGLSAWEDAFGEDTQLYFEVNLPSPAEYRKDLRTRLAERVLTPTALATALATVRATARAKAPRLEGSTKVDAVVVSPTTGAAVAFEAKVLSDVSTAVTFDATRNQLARLVDVTLDPTPKLVEPALRDRRPARTCVVLLTPALFQQDRHSRLYGHLHDTYRSRPEVLAGHLPHRDGVVVTAAVRRLGWATWEDVEEVRPGSLPWKTPFEG